MRWCGARAAQDTKNALRILNLAGIFYIVIGGLLLAVLSSLLECSVYLLVTRVRAILELEQLFLVLYVFRLFAHLNFCVFCSHLLTLNVMFTFISNACIQWRPLLRHVASVWSRGGRRVGGGGQRFGCRFGSSNARAAGGTAALSLQLQGSGTCGTTTLAPASAAQIQRLCEQVLVDDEVAVTPTLQMPCVDVVAGGGGF